MKPSKGYYSLIQYCPDLGRLEAANVGVLLFCPERMFLEARVSKTNERIRDFFGAKGHDWQRIKSLKQGICDRVEREQSSIRGVEDLEKFIAQRANLIQITAPRPMKVTDPEAELDQLFKELVGETAKRSSSKNLKKILDERFHEAHLDRKVRRDVMIEVPAFEKPVAFPFGFKNGRFNLINPVSFMGDHVDQSVATACKYAVEGRSLYFKPDPEPELGQLQLVIVGHFRADDQEAPQAVRRVFQENNVKLFRDTELHTLVDEIRRTGKDINEASA